LIPGAIASPFDLARTPRQTARTISAVFRRVISKPLYPAGENGDLDKAITDFTEAIRLDPSQCQGYYIRGLVYKLMGDIGKAEQDFARVKQLGH